MKIKLVSVGKPRRSELLSLTEDFFKRIPHYMPFEAVVIPDVKAGRNASEAEIKRREGELILAQAGGGDRLVLMDERGREFTSREFAAWIERHSISVPGSLIIVIGGPYGFSEAVYARADEKISLSRMTLTHEMARLFAAEQLYRAMTILRGEPYHHD
ncbi:MAG: 23S rRNA (pseudouridine(1915)-N(3))-methyltransferase RlmH [Muribaculaceae bacterium]|nr:23S rRNA (pseudouridine(1915)-N(3))-methyltransferase RlmH [Muribaculaceae bacterium]